MVILQGNKYKYQLKNPANSHNVFIALLKIIEKAGVGLKAFPLKSTIIVLFLIFGLSAAARASSISSEEEKGLLMYFPEEDVVSATRAEKPLGQTAENVTIIKADQIKLMNAHTLADVLYWVPGVEVDPRATIPGFPVTAVIDGSEPRHVLVMMDGVPLNNLSDSLADIGSIPVQDIKRIEIIKGPASSAWGSSLGGLINIITKSPGKFISGSASASYGERNATDFNAEISGPAGPIGLYARAGHTGSDGFYPYTRALTNDLYVKATADIAENLTAWGALWYNNAKSGLEIPFFMADSAYTHEYMYAAGGLDYKPFDGGKISLNLRTSKYDINRIRSIASLGFYQETPSRNEDTGGSLKFTYATGAHAIVAGLDLEHGSLEVPSPGFELGITKYAGYVNDTITMGRWAVTPGIREDHNTVSGSFTSPSLGVTYEAARWLLLRAQASRGFNAPPLGVFEPELFYTVNPDLKMEQVWSYNAGVEIAAPGFSSIKATVFLHNVKDEMENVYLSPTLFTVENIGKTRHQGAELEVRTNPVYHTDLSAGVVFIDSTDRTIGEVLKNTPRYTYDIGADYVTEKLKADLRGHYIWWNADSQDPLPQAKYNGFVWDLSVTGRVYNGNTLSASLFLTAHNIFDVSEDSSSIYPTPRRWVEAGTRFELF